MLRIDDIVLDEAVNSPTRMAAFVNRFESTVFDLSIDLSRPDAGVAKQFLQGSDFCTTSQHVRCKAVP